jgi:uncharacterized protein with NRDE domain
MCLIAVAHRLSDDFPLVIAANRDEFYERPALAAAPWKEDARVVGGRDVRAGGSWLAVREDARFAAVTNIRGEHRDGPSRGLLVSNFVLSDAGAVDFANSIRRAEYAGFHLILGDGTTVAHITNANDAPPSIIEPGSIFAVSNGVPGDDWPKVELAREAMQSAIANPESLLDFLTTRRGGAIEQEVFVAVPELGYGTRSSTVIVVDKNADVTFIERAAPSGAEVRWRLPSRS